MADGSTGTMVWGAEPTSDERLFALGAHLSIFVVPILAPLAIYLIKKEDSAFVRYHALQAFIWQMVAWILGSAICIGPIIGSVVAIIWALKANKGEWEGYPLLASVGSEE